MDATIIEAPSSTKHRTGERYPEMHQTREGNQWHFGMKAHIGVGAGTGIVRMSTTAANAYDTTETVVWDDFGYQGVGCGWECVRGEPAKAGAREH